MRPISFLGRAQYTITGGLTLSKQQSHMMHGICSCAHNSASQVVADWAASTLAMSAYHLHASSLAMATSRNLCRVKLIMFLSR